MPGEEPRVLSLLSHELRGPLGVIRGYLRLLAQASPELSDGSRKTVAAALRASDRLAEVLDEASLFAHLRTGKVTLDPKPTLLTTITEAAVQAAALPAGVEVDVEPLPSVMLHADGRHLSTAVATFITVVARSQPNSRIVAIGAEAADLAGAPAVRLLIRAHTALGATETDLHLGRGGYGLAVPIAATVVEGHGGQIREFRQDQRIAGIVVSLPHA